MPGARYYCLTVIPRRDNICVISDFKCEATAQIYEGESTLAFPSDIQNTARRKLRMLDAATSLNDLRSPPGNRLEKLKGSRAGQYSIRINDQWRVCFVWEDGEVREVEIVDYH